MTKKNALPRIAVATALPPARDATPPPVEMPNPGRPVGPPPVEMPVPPQGPPPIAESGVEADLRRSQGRKSHTITTRAFDYFYDRAEQHFVRLNSMGAALKRAGRELRERVVETDGVFDLRPLNAIEKYLESRALHARGATAWEPAAVAARRRDWDEAKRSGDPDAMTRTANALIRAAGRQRAQSNSREAARADSPYPASRPTIEEILNPRVAQSDADMPPGETARLRESDDDMPPGEMARLPQSDDEMHPGETARLRQSDADMAPGETFRIPESDADMPPGETARAADGDEHAAEADERIRIAAAAMAEASHEQRMAILGEARDLFGDAFAAKVLEYVPFELVEQIVRSDRSGVGGMSAARQRLGLDRGAANSTAVIPLAVSNEEAARLKGDDFDARGSRPRARVEYGEPYRIANLLRRHRGMEQRRWREFVNPDRDRQDWANPDFGWKTNLTTLSLLEIGREGELTIEALQFLCDAAYWDSLGPDEDYSGRDYMPVALEDNPAFFDEGSGWERIAGVDDPELGIRMFALYHKNTDTVIVVSRGTRFSRADFGTDDEIYNGRSPHQFVKASEFLRDKVWRWMRDNGHDRSKVILTGHSLGGALAQLQLAVAHRSADLKGMNAFAVTFAALGARDAIRDYERRFSSNWTPGDHESYAKARMVNLVREGDGYPQRGAIYGARPAGLGQTHMLRGLYMDEIRELERTIDPRLARKLLNQYENDPFGEFGDWLDRLRKLPDAHARLAYLYYLNHSIRSYYRPEFSLPWQDGVARLFGRRPFN